MRVATSRRPSKVAAVLVDPEEAVAAVVVPAEVDLGEAGVDAAAASAAAVVEDWVR